MSEKAPIKWKFKRKMTGIEDGSGPQKKQNQPPPKKNKHWWKQRNWRDQRQE